MWHHPRTGFHKLSRPLTEHIYRSAEAIVAYGEHVKRFVVDTSGVDPGKVYVAGQAVEPEPFAAVQKANDGSAEVLFVGQFEERKGLVHLLEAFAAQPDLPAKLRLIGNGSLEPQLSRHAAQDPRIELVGYVPQEDLPGELARSRCLVLPSITTDLAREPWGLVVNEAMHTGLPVVATDAVGAAAGGLVEDGRNGFVVPECDALSMAEAVRRLVLELTLAARMGAQARRDVRRFDYKAMADAFEAAIEHAIAARR